jgi:hypothetical protein
MPLGIELFWHSLHEQSSILYKGDYELAYYFNKGYEFSKELKDMLMYQQNSNHDL